MKSNIFFYPITFLGLVLLFCFYSPPNISYAQEASTITYEKTNPDSQFRYKIKRLGEKITLFRLNLLNKSGVVEFRIELLERRVNEVVYLTDNKEVHYLETSTSRYTTEVGLLFEELGNSPNSTDMLKNTLAKHIKIFEVARDKFPAQTSNWILLQQLVDVANVHSQQP